MGNNQYSGLFDLHTHSIYSHDGNHSIDELCQAAINAGLAGIAITDHFDLPQCDTPECQRVINVGYQEILETKEKYSDKLKILAGIEIGNITDESDVVKSLLESQEYDVVLGSIHELTEYGEFYYLDFKDIDVNCFMGKYFCELYAQCKTGLFDVAAHLDYPTRYIISQGFDCPLEPYFDQIDEILKLVIQNGKVIELNTAGLYRETKCTQPPLKILKRYKELGGELVTMGSDAHHAENVGRGLVQAVDMLKEAGFRYVTYYEKRIPFFQSL